MNERTHLDLFSGIGGFALAAQWAGFRTVAFCERELFCQFVLKKHWPEVPIHDDICKLDGAQYRGVDLLTGGFPCQPVSYSGKRKGKEDDRWLWPEMLGVISESKPRWVISENVDGLDGLGLDDCISDLEALGYEVAPPLEIPAGALNAAQQRNRFWILANSNGNGLETPPHEIELCKQGRDQGANGHCGAMVRPPLLSPDELRALVSEPDFLGKSYGISGETHRIKSLGNAIVPQVAEMRGNGCFVKG